MSDWVSRVTGSTTHVSDVTPLNKSNQSEHRVHHPRVWSHTPEQEQPIKTQDSPTNLSDTHPWTRATNQKTGFPNQRVWCHTPEHGQPIKTQDSPTNVSDVTPLNKSNQSKHRIHHPLVWRHTPEQERPIKTQYSPPTCLTSHPWTRATNQNTGFTTHVSEVTPLNTSNQSKHRIHHPRVWRHTPEQEQPIKTQDSIPTCLTSHPWTRTTN
jgi:hypothetical protein